MTFWRTANGRCWSAFCSFLFVCGVVVSLATLGYEYLNARLTSAISIDVRHRLFAHLQRVSTGFYGRIKSGQVLSRFSSDMEAVDELLTYGIDWGLLPALELVAGVVLLFILYPGLALLSLAVFPLTLIGPRLVAPRAIEATYLLQRREADALAVVNENVGSQPLVRALSLQRVSMRWYRERNRLVRREMARVRFFDALIERTVTISVLLLHLVVFGVGAVLAYEEVITVGTFVTFEAVYWEVSYNITHVTQFIPSLIDGAGSVRHINDLLDEPESVVERTGARPAPRLSRQLRFERVSFSYDGATQHIHDASFTVPAGSRVAIVGESGAGKSTLLALLMRLDEPTSGRIIVDDVHLQEVSRESLREQLAIVFQDNILFSTTIRENIRLGRQSATDAEVDEAARAAEIHRFIASLPNGYDTAIGERGSSLFGRSAAEARDCAGDRTRSGNPAPR
jgi:ATP-binding cassette subfamily B protein